MFGRREDRFISATSKVQEITESDQYEGGVPDLAVGVDIPLSQGHKALNVDFNFLKALKD